MLPCMLIPSKKVSTLKRNLAPLWSKFFPFRVDPFSVGMQNNFDRVTSHELYECPLRDIEMEEPIQHVFLV